MANQSEGRGLNVLTDFKVVCKEYMLCTLSSGFRLKLSLCSWQRKGEWNTGFLKPSQMLSLAPYHLGNVDAKPLF